MTRRSGVCLSGQDRAAPPSRALTYGRYLRLDELLGLQRPLSEGPEHDETLFIISHQVSELWFKEMLHEIDHARRLMVRGDRPRVLHTLKRVLTVLKALVAQLDILETMTPIEFQSFRERLEEASGLQSFQFRELEYALGSKDPSAIERFPSGSLGRARLEERLEASTLWDAFLHYLEGEGLSVPIAQLSRDVRQSVAPSEGVQEVLLEAYRTNPGVESVCEMLVDLDEGLQEWRYRHVKMVERTVGMKRGTGGSEGSAYLRTTLNQPVFPDLWMVRNRF